MTKTLAAVSGIGMIVVAMLIYGGFYIQAEGPNSNLGGVAYQSGEITDKNNQDVDCTSDSDCEDEYDCIKNKCVHKKDIQFNFPNR